MSRPLAALLGCLFLAGCGSPPAPLAVDPEPSSPQPVVIEERVDPSVAEGRNDDDTRQRALRVFAAEQRSLLGTLEGETRFVRTAGGPQQRLRSALFASDQDLVSIEQAIEDLGRDDSISSSDRRARHDELKDRLRRLATRLSLLENAIRAR
jgi:hypothetical protein